MVESSIGRSASTIALIRLPRAISLSAGALLLAAAALKVYGLSAPVPASPLWRQTAPSTIVLALCEAAVGLGLVLDGRRAWIGAAAFLFSAFTLFSAWQWSTGAESCACWGKASVSPAIMLWFDANLTVLLSLTFFEVRAPAGPLLALRPRLLTVAALIAALGTGAAYQLSRASALLANQVPGVEITAAGYVVLDPARWQGTRWPLADLAPQTGELTSGNWRVLFFHHDCPRCQPWLDAIAAGDLGDPWALIEVPPARRRRFDNPRRARGEPARRPPMVH